MANTNNKYKKSTYTKAKTNYSKPKKETATPVKKSTYAGPKPVEFKYRGDGSPADLKLKMNAHNFSVTQRNNKRAEIYNAAVKKEHEARMKVAIDAGANPEEAALKLKEIPSKIPKPVYEQHIGGAPVTGKPTVFDAARANAAGTSRQYSVGATAYDSARARQSTYAPKTSRAAKASAKEMTAVQSPEVALGNWATENTPAALKLKEQMGMYQRYKEDQAAKQFLAEQSSASEVAPIAENALGAEAGVGATKGLAKLTGMIKSNPKAWAAGAGGLLALGLILHHFKSKEEQKSQPQQSYSSGQQSYSQGSSSGSSYKSSGRYTK